jgi:uncharacterized protein (TIGR02145 family)
VKIGNQWWMAENLAVTRFNDSTALNFIDINSSDSEWANASGAAYTSLNNGQYGFLYNFAVVENTKNIAPEGWHVPTDEEWLMLEKEIGMSSEETQLLGWRGTNEANKLAALNAIGWPANFPLFGLDEYYEPSKTVVFQMEPWVYDNSKPWGIKTWGEWAEPDTTKFLHVNSHKNYLNNVEWHIGLPLEEISKTIECEKMDKISSICSSKNYDIGQILRNNFIKYLEEQYPQIVEVYGKFNFHNFECYKGPLKDDDKMNGLIQYKYHFACENNAENGYATEKIWDAILSETLCFYWGCPNLEQYIDSHAFVRLDLNDFQLSLEIIKQAIEEDWWTQRIEVIRREKKRIIEELAFFPNLKKIIESKSEELKIEISE